MIFFKKKQKPAPVPVTVPEPIELPRQEVYDFIVKSTDEKTDKALTKYQKLYTEPEDKYCGMKLMEFKEEGVPGDKIYQYPLLDVDVEIEAKENADGETEIHVSVIEGIDKSIHVGTAAKTKAKKIKRILDKDPGITAELYGGKYWKMESSGYVNNDWSEDLTVRVYLTYEP